MIPFTAFVGTLLFAYSPLTGRAFSRGHSTDYWTLGVLIGGFGSIATAIYILTTILCMRCPGMTLMKMPVFVWTSLITNILIVGAFPVLTATLALLSADRTLGMHFFTNEAGGNAMQHRPQHVFGAVIGIERVPVDAVLHVVRCFEGGDITHVEGSVDPLRDIDTIDTELMYADLETVEKTIDKHRKLARAGDKDALAAVPIIENVIGPSNSVTGPFQPEVEPASTGKQRYNSH